MMAFLWPNNKQRKWGTGPPILLSQSASMALRKFFTYFHVDWIILACREVWPNSGDLLGQVGPWTATEDVQHILRELGMWQVNFFEVLTQDTVTAGLIAKILLFMPPGPGLGCWYPCWAQSWNKTLRILGNPLLIWGKMTTPRSR